MKLYHCPQTRAFVAFSERTSARPAFKRAQEIEAKEAAKA